jgi:hypothetical protein
MSYPALPDKRIGYDNDGTAVYYTVDQAGSFATGPTTQLTGTPLIALNGYVPTVISQLSPGVSGSNAFAKVWFFFPEKREFDGWGLVVFSGAWATPQAQGSNDTTNGMDGTWETASFPSGTPPMWSGSPDAFRASIVPVSFTGTKQTVRVLWGYIGSYGNFITYQCHLYGIKDASATPNDLIFMSAASGGTQVLNVDVGDVGFGTTRTVQVWLANTSASKTASNINLQLNDADWIFSIDNATWATTLNIASLGPGARYGPIYVRQTSPAQGSRLGPRFARIVVSGYTFA